MSAGRKVSYVLSIWHDAEREPLSCWKGDLETSAGQHLPFNTLAELNHLICELGGWIDRLVVPEIHTIGDKHESNRTF